MNTYLLLWNPETEWKTLEGKTLEGKALDEDIKQIEKNGKCSQRWSCGNTKSIQYGDRFFLLKIGEKEPKGIIGTGFVASLPFQAKHWRDENKDALYIHVDFDVLLNADKEPILTIDILEAGNLKEQHWHPMSSGITVRPKIVDELEEVWFNFLITQKIRHNVFTQIDNETQKTYIEGTPSQVIGTIYERNPYARKKCIEHHGLSCVVCGFDFEKKYGDVGKGFIHVHHLRKIATENKAHQIDPIEDLRPVCANCHSIIHKRKEPYRIEECIEFINHTY